MAWTEIATALGGAVLDTATLVARGEGGEPELATAWLRAYGAPWPPCDPVSVGSARLWLASSGRVAFVAGGRFEVRELPGRGGPTLGARIGSALAAFLGQGDGAPPSASPRPRARGDSVLARSAAPHHQARVRRPREP